MTNMTKNSVIVHFEKYHNVTYFDFSNRWSGKWDSFWDTLCRKRRFQNSSNMFLSIEWRTSQDSTERTLSRYLIQVILLVLIHSAADRYASYVRPSVLTYLTHCIKSRKIQQFLNENKDRYWRCCGSGRGDHWWHCLVDPPNPCLVVVITFTPGSLFDVLPTVHQTNLCYDTKDGAWWVTLNSLDILLIHAQAQTKAQAWKVGGSLFLVMVSVRTYIRLSVRPSVRM